MLPGIVLGQSCLWMVATTDGAKEAMECIELALPWLRVDPEAITHPMVLIRDIDQLALTNRFPAENHFLSVLRLVGLDSVIDAKTLATAVGRYLSTAKFFEDDLVKDALFSNAILYPDMFSALPNAARDHSESSVCFVALIENISKKLHFLAECRFGAFRRTLTVQCDVDAIEEISGSKYDCGPLASDLVFLAKPAQFLDSLTPIDVWQLAECSMELEIAIELQARSIAAAQGSGAVPSFRVGSEFMAALHKVQAACKGPFASLTLSKCAMALVAPATASARPLRTSSAATASVKKRMRDGAMAMRAHLTGGHAGLRLMYWQMPCGMIEFATVRTKFDIQIDEGEILGRRLW